MYQLTQKRSPILKFLGFFLAISITAELLKVIFQGPSINEQLMDTAKEINKHCPIMVDSLTRLDNSIATLDNKLQFNYTFINKRGSHATFEIRSVNIYFVGFNKRIIKLEFIIQGCN